MKKTFTSKEDTLELSLELHFVQSNMELILYHLTHENREICLMELEILNAIENNASAPRTSQQATDILLAVDNSIQAIKELNKPMFSALYKIYREQNYKNTLKEFEQK